MAHKTRVSGTNYSISGGKCRVSGTNYSVKKGRTRISATNYDINFTIGISSVTLNYASSVNVGSSISPTVTISPTNYSAYKSRTFSITSGTSYATINSSTGVLTGKAAGSVTVKVTIVDALGNTVTATKSVTVKEQTYTATIKKGSNNRDDGISAPMIEITDSNGTRLFYKKKFSMKDEVSGNSFSNITTFTKSGITKNSTVSVGFYSVGIEFDEDAEHWIKLNGTSVGKWSGDTTLKYDFTVTTNFTITCTVTGTGSNEVWTIEITT